ncbi:MAG: S-layer homology domain-containing protein [Oscillospiraceae bacterium]|nr:S-layer homology domain-containing protein [Oscillospiraceae bacterium]
MSIKKLSIILIMGALLLPNTALATGDSAPVMSGWAQEEVAEAVELGLVTDNLGGDYTVPITRLQFSGLAVRFAETMRGAAITPLGTETFDDTADTAVLKAAAAGITNGTGPNNFSPDALITREEIATMVFRAVGYVDAEKLPEPADLTTYSDEASVSGWAQGAVKSMVASGVMQGTSATTLAPKNNTSIEEAIALLLRAYHIVCDEVKTTDENATPTYKGMEQYVEVFDAEEYETIEGIISDDLNNFSNYVGINDINDIVDVYKLYYPSPSDIVDVYEQNGTLVNCEFKYYKWYVQIKDGSKVWLAYDEETEKWMIQETAYPISPSPVETTTTDLVTQVLAENFDTDAEIEVAYLYYAIYNFDCAYIIADDAEYLLPFRAPKYSGLEVGKLYTLDEIVAVLKENYEESA